MKFKHHKRNIKYRIGGRSRGMLQLLAMLDEAVDFLGIGLRHDIT